MFETQARFICVFCGAENVADVDLSGGIDQEYIEDCEVCCAPNKIHIHFDEKYFRAVVTSDFDE
ncbi:MAG: CPXCG motif-containing cysteine-rich protein [Calditrichaeota bacterium]|nr:MAG: CPXCG motif-containing cysteine-rich protein [Calditrichota bacterium]